MRNASRRRFLGTLAAGSALSLAGCSNSPGSSGGTDGLVFKKLPEEYVLTGERKIVMNDNLREDYEMEPGQQLRAGRRASTGSEESTETTETASAPKPQNPSVFTHRTEPPIEPDYYEVYLSERNLKRLDSEVGERASLSPFAPNPDITTRTGARKNNEYIEQKIDQGSRDEYLIALAPHGGQVEAFTAQQAKRIANRMGVAAWLTLGFDGDGREAAQNRWFVPTPEIAPISYPKLESLDNDYQFAISFDGFREPPRKTDGEAIAVGGLISESKRQRVASEIEKKFEDAGVSDVSVYAYKTGAGRGTSSDHLVNRMSNTGRNGIEVAQTLEVRRKHWDKVADGVEEALRSILNEYDSDWNSQ